MTGALSPALRHWVQAETASTVVSAHTIGRGASRQIWAVALATDREVVVRADTGDGPVAGTSLTLGREAAVYRALAHTDLPIPRLHAVHPDGTALLLDRAPGDDQLKTLSATEGRSVAEDYGRCLGRLHQLAPDSLELGPLAVPDGADPTAHDLDLWCSIDRTRRGDALPIAPVALRHLAGSVPSAARVSLCHGDAGPGNFLHEGGRVTALLDWEFAHVGDPHDDLAWVVVRNQVLRHPLDVAATFAAWRATTGAPVDVAHLEWFRALVLTRMLISCDATIAWAGPDAASARVQAVLRPFLAVAVFEALRRAGAGTDLDTTELEHQARAAWKGSPVADLLDDPIRLDDLGALL
ncbi:MAG: phosphotransferase family protein [Acidimicrobiales bacterium]